jgi:S1-C subfamily serine protease
MIRKLMMVVAVMGLVSGWLWAQEDVSDARMTPLVNVVQTTSPSVVNITGLEPIEGHDGSFTLSWGTGSILHESGFMVTNAHVAADDGQQVVTLNDGRQYAYRVICESVGQDIAIIKADSDTAFDAITLGRSHDLMLGETVVVIGNPGGLSHTVTTGIISGLGRVTGADDSYLTGTIQTDAAINGGNSGGPLINMNGEQIGIIVAKKLDTEGLGFAIPIDRLREILPTMLSAEMRYGYSLGIEVDTFGPAVVLEVAAESPASDAGVQVGDVVTAFGEMAVTDGVHFYLSLAERTPDEGVSVTVDRAGETLVMDVTLAAIAPLAATELEAGELTPGVTMSLFSGAWTQLPDFDTLEPTSTVVVPTISLDQRPAELTDNFGAEFEGYVQVLAEGLYTFSTTSDDGSQLFIDGQLIVNNDGLHGAIESEGMVRLAAGYHALRVTFFEAQGGEALSVSIVGPVLPKQVIGSDMLFTPIRDASEDPPSE